MINQSSKKCSCCEVINEALTLADREWTCQSCGNVHNRDLNAAINIKNAGIKLYASRGTASEPVEPRTKVRAKKQELFVNRVTPV